MTEKFSGGPVRRSGQAVWSGAAGVVADALRLDHAPAACGLGQRAVEVVEGGGLLCGATVGVAVDGLVDPTALQCRCPSLHLDIGDRELGVPLRVQLLAP